MHRHEPTTRFGTRALEPSAGDITQQTETRLKAIAREHARHGITANVVCPGPTETALFADYKEGAGDLGQVGRDVPPFHPLGRIEQPDDRPGASVFHASDDAVSITGQVLSGSGGLTMAG